MDYDEDKIDEVILALLGVFEFQGGRVWKRFDFDAMDRLHASGMISEPKGRAESVYLTDAGLERARAVAARYFGKTSS